MFKAKQPAEHKINLGSQPREQRHAFVSTACVTSDSRGAKRRHHHNGRDDQYAGDDGETDFHTAFSAVEHGVERAQERPFLLFLYFSPFFIRFIDYLVQGLFLHDSVGHRGIQFGIALQRQLLHHARGDDTADERPCQSDQGAATVTAPRHEGHHHQSHAEGGAEVGQRGDLVLFEVAPEGLVLRQRDDSRIVAQEGHHRAERSHAGEIVKRLHQRLQHLL